MSTFSLTAMSEYAFISIVTRMTTSIKAKLRVKQTNMNTCRVSKLDKQDIDIKE